MTHAEIIAKYEEDLALAKLAGEPESWGFPVAKADLREMLEALKLPKCMCVIPATQPQSGSMTITKWTTVP